MATALQQSYTTIDPTGMKGPPTFGKPAFFGPDMGLDDTPDAFDGCFRTSYALLHPEEGDDDYTSTTTTTSVSTMPSSTLADVWPPVFPPDPMDSPFLGRCSPWDPACFLTAVPPPPPLPWVSSSMSVTDLAPSVSWATSSSSISSPPDPMDRPGSPGGMVVVTDGVADHHGGHVPRRRPSSPRPTTQGPMKTFDVRTEYPSTESHHGQLTPPHDRITHLAHGHGAMYPPALDRTDLFKPEMEPVEADGQALTNRPPTSAVIDARSSSSSTTTTTRPRRHRRPRRAEASDDTPEPAGPAAKRRRKTDRADLAALTTSPIDPEPIPTMLSPMVEKEESRSDPEDDEQRRKRNRFLQRNRVAASKCRRKKKEWMGQLEVRGRALQLEKDHLTVAVKALKDQVLWLKGELLKHDTCDCERIRRYVRLEADQLAPDPHRRPRRRHPRHGHQDGDERRSTSPPGEPDPVDDARTNVDGSGRGPDPARNRNGLAGG